MSKCDECGKPTKDENELCEKCFNDCDCHPCPYCNETTDNSDNYCSVCGHQQD